MQEVISEQAMSIDGYLFPAGLVPLSEKDFNVQITQRDALVNKKKLASN